MNQDELSNAGISLVDLVLVILRRRGTLFAIFAIFVIFATVYFASSVDLFRYSVVVEVGSYAVPDKDGALGERIYIEPLAQVEQRVRSQLGPIALRNLFQGDGDKVRVPEIAVDAPQGSNIVIVHGIGPKDDRKLISVLGNVSTALVSTHEEELLAVKEQLRQKAELHLLKVVELAAKRREMEGRANSLKEAMGLIGEHEKILKMQIDSLKLEETRLVGLKDQIAAGEKGLSEPLALLLLDYESSDLKERIQEGEVLLNITLKDERLEKSAQLQSAVARMAVADQALTNARRTLSRYGVEEEASLDAFYLQENSSLLLNIKPSRVVVPASRSLEKVGLSVWYAVVLILLSGIVLGVVACFFHEFLDEVKLAYLKRL